MAEVIEEMDAQTRRKVEQQKRTTNRIKLLADRAKVVLKSGEVMCGACGNVYEHAKAPRIRHFKTEGCPKCGHPRDAANNRKYVEPANTPA